MKAKLFILTLFISFALTAQNSLWKSSYEPLDQTVVPQDRIPAQYKSLEVDFAALQNDLLKAPGFKNKTGSTVHINLPDENGNLIDFTVYKSNTLPNQLKQQSGIQTYRAYSKHGDIASIVTSMFGLHAGILRPGKPDLIIEPASRDLNNVIVFSKSALPPKSFECYTEDIAPSVDLSKSSIKIDDQVLRTYRFAIGTTGEYSQYHVNRAINLGIIPSNATDSQKKDAVLSAVAVTVDRLNSVYERDLGVTLELVPNERDVIFLDPNTDPYDNSDIISMLDNNTTVLNNNIGTNNYDGGHLFTTYAGGGISGLGIICSSQKGRSVTGSTSPIGDGYDIDYVAHEIGHAFGCNHTFANSCNNNRNLSTSVEPGSGSSIMAYAGVCSPNVQLHSDDYFHVISIAEAGNFISNYATCSINTNIGNHAPSINVLNYGNVYIPKSTPFLLHATATDADGDALTYCWEQIDAVTNSSTTNWVPNATHTNGPEFRSYDPTTNTNRYFPRVVNIVNNTYQNTWEVLPEVNRTLTFAITVRDNHAGGGQTPFDYVQFSIDQNTGPFRVTNMSNGETLQAGETKTITWNVAGTDGGLVNCPTVDILFSADNGVTFPYTIASNIPNNGSAQFSVPGYENTNLGRFMVKAHNNYFFDLAHGRFTIQGAGAVALNNLNHLKIYPNPAKNTIHISFDDIDNQAPVNVSLVDVSGREIYNRTFNAHENFDQIISTDTYARGIYLIKIINGSKGATQKLILE